MEKEVANTTQHELIPSQNDFDRLRIIARSASRCGLYKMSEDQILMILLAARELGIMPLQALNGGIWNIQGRIELSARIMGMMIRRAGHSIKTIDHTDTNCVLEGKRSDNGDMSIGSFNWDDATNAGLSSRQTWKQYPQDMLYARALSRLARRLFPDVIGTCYVEGEISDSKGTMISPEQLPASEAEVTPANDEIHINKLKEITEKILAECNENEKSVMVPYLAALEKHYKEKKGSAWAEFLCSGLEKLNGEIKAKAMEWSINQATA